MPGVAAHAGRRSRHSRMGGGQGRVTLPALLPGLRRGPEIVHAMAGDAVRRFDFGPSHDERAMLALEEFLLLPRVAPAAEGGDFVRCGDAVRRDGSSGITVFHTGAVAGVAAQSFLEMRVGLKVGDLLGVAWRAEFVRLLGQNGRGK